MVRFGQVLNLLQSLTNRDFLASFVKKFVCLSDSGYRCSVVIIIANGILCRASLLCLNWEKNNCSFTLGTNQTIPVSNSRFNEKNGGADSFFVNLSLLIPKNKGSQPLLFLMCRCHCRRCRIVEGNFYWILLPFACFRRHFRSATFNSS